MSPMELAAAALSVGPAGIGLMLFAALSVSGLSPLQVGALLTSLAVLETLCPEVPE